MPIIRTISQIAVGGQGAGRLNRSANFQKVVRAEPLK